MNRLWKIGALTAAIAVAAAALASGLVSIRVGSPGEGALAAPSEADASANTARPFAPPSLVAVAIGQLEEEDGEYSTVDLRASIRDDKAVGALRFYSEEYGYYNGGVRTLVVEDGLIKVTGGGGLFQPDGTRAAVRYEAEFALDGSHASIHVTGRDLDYTMEGSLDGFVHLWEPTATG